MATVNQERDGAVAVLMLHRPERLNAVSEELYGELLAALAAIDADATIRALIITGAGRAFCVGADLKAHGEGGSERDAASRRNYIELAQRANRTVQRLGKPVIAAVNGHAIGAGLELALSCDLVVVSRAAKLRFPEAALGTCVGGGVTRTLVRRVGLARAQELLLLCEFFTADDALAWGMINRAVAAPEVLPVARALAARIATHAPVSLRLMKRLLDRAPSPSRVLRAEAAALLACMATADWREGVRAFEEQRAPEFIGR
jgi:enoyl-CoA hydratase/carnithine racemase